METRGAVTSPQHSGAPPASGSDSGPSPPQPQSQRQRQRQRLILLCDGTWNSRFNVPISSVPRTAPENKGRSGWYSNVALLSLIIPPLTSPTAVGTGTGTATQTKDEQEQEQEQEQIRQEVYYLSGIGSDIRLTHPFLSFLSGAFAAQPMVQKVVEAYSWLCDNWLPGDEICLVGFSRGAFTARAVAGLLGWMGVLGKAQQDESKSSRDKVANGKGNDISKGDDSSNANPHYNGNYNLTHFLRFDEIWAAYSARDPRKPETLKHAAKVLYDCTGLWPASDAQHFHFQRPDDRDPSTAGTNGGSHVVPPPIRVIAVFDTVKALGVPGFFQDDTADNYYDATLGSEVQNAFQALAMDEDRKDFEPVLWYLPQEREDRGTPEGGQRPRTNLKQMWFRGSHVNVGGSLSAFSHGPSDITLAWEISQLMTTLDDRGLPLIEIDIEAAKALQDRSEEWGKGKLYKSRQVVQFQATRNVCGIAPPLHSHTLKGPTASSSPYPSPSALQRQTNEFLHHSVTLSPSFSPTDPPPSLAHLGKTDPTLFQRLYSSAADPNSLSSIEKSLQWSSPSLSHPPPQATWHPAPKWKALLSRLVSDLINRRRIPQREQNEGDDGEGEGNLKSWGIVQPD